MTVRAHSSWLGLVLVVLVYMSLHHGDYGALGGCRKGADRRALLPVSVRKAIETFRGVLDRAGLAATVRLTRGREIEAACGQLAAARAA